MTKIDLTDELAPSRSAKKRAAQAVEEIAERLADLPEGQWQKLPASAEVRTVIAQARAIKAFGARKRQVKHLAAVLREREEEIQDLLDFLGGVSRQHLREQKDFHALEELRERLCRPEDFPGALEEVRRTFPGVDAEALARLAAVVHANGDRRAFREIFRRLRQASGAGGAQE